MPDNELVKSFEFEPGTVLRGGELPDGSPYLIAADVCRIIGISDTDSALRRVDEDEKGTVSIRTLGGTQSLSYVNESGFYNLVLGSRNRKNSPNAARLARFKKWVTSEVLPSIRKTGRYDISQPAATVPAVAEPVAPGVETDVRLSNLALLRGLLEEVTNTTIRSIETERVAREAAASAAMALESSEKAASSVTAVSEKLQNLSDNIAGSPGFMYVATYVKQNGWRFPEGAHRRIGLEVSKYCTTHGIERRQAGVHPQIHWTYPIWLLDKLCMHFGEWAHRGVDPAKPKKRKGSSPQTRPMFDFGEDDYTTRPYPGRN